MAFGGACDTSVYRTASSLLISAKLVSYNCPMRMTSETLWIRYFIKAAEDSAMAMGESYDQGDKVNETEKHRDGSSASC
ncbi:uncharacterized protein N7500_008954 [Penicillium coprophilum]|uniref:uncharacterized protein n=1 Tax=Penicillium coprophilum TaxID=36646 RepID=UPI0023916AF2|nr:uncharacterized protein N7500_008954 [Penicillium coprophilum]KAJ5159303.1 hypothetical protein N7500_008954 [Penicillium coprophilum]